MGGVSGYASGHGVVQALSLGPAEPWPLALASNRLEASEQQHICG